MCHYHSNETSARCLKEICHKIYQNSNSRNRHQNERNIKIPAQTFKEGINDFANTKGGADGQTWVKTS